MSQQDNELLVTIKKCKSSFYYAGVVSFFINLLMLVPSLYMLQLYDRVISSRSLETLFMLTLIMVILFVFMGVMEFIRSRILVRVGNQIDNHLRERIFQAMFFLANRHPGQATTQPLNDLVQVRQFMTGTPIFAFFDLPWIPVYMTILFMFHMWFGYFAIFAAIVILTLTLINEWRTKSGLEQSNKIYQSSARFLDSSLRNSEVIEAMGMHDSIHKRWMEKHMDFLDKQTRASDEAGIWSTLSKNLRMLFQSLILGLGGYLAVKAELTPGMMIAGSIIMGRALAPMDLLTNTWKQFVSARDSYHRLGELLRETPLPLEPMSLPAPNGSIQIEGISVIPPEAKQPSIRDFSISIKAGEVVGIIGPSAAGKSTLARAMLGIWKPLIGKVRIDGAEIGHYNRVELGQYIGYLPQDIELFDGTIAENIARYGEVDSSKVLEAAKLAGVHEMILRFSKGYDTPIGQGGIALSGGQRQRIALARAVYSFPRIVVLDEPNSNLDDTGERALLQAIFDLKARGITVVLITHRMAVLNAADKIALLRDGILQAYGSKDDILRALAAQNQQDSLSNSANRA
ncbi:MAG: type I secretion system permease/ATPase [Wolinella sp.]